MTPARLNTSSIALDIVDDAALGAELTALYHDANDGFRRVLRFGARFLQIEDRVTIVTRSGHHDTKGTGMAAWLATHAPEIARSTAYKYRDVTEALAKKYKIADPVLCFSAPATELPPAEAAQQAKALDFVAEKSIRQVQLELNLIEPPKIGGARVSTKKLTPAEEQAFWIEAAKKRAVLAFSAVHTLDGRWKLLPDAQVRQAVDDAKAFLKEAGEWLATPPPNRLALDAAKLMEATR